MFIILTMQEKKAIKSSRIVRPAVFVLLLLCPAVFRGSASDGAVATIDVRKKYQKIEGFGGGFMFNKYPFFHPKKDELYDSIFNKAGVNIVRIWNAYNPQEGNMVPEIPMMTEILEKWPSVKIIFTAWSPPAYLKNNNSLVGLIVRMAGDSVIVDSATLKKDSDGEYIYETYADYWLQSLHYFKRHGVTIDWLSIQNEPDCAIGYESCALESTESATIASYGKALDAVYNKLHTEMTDPPPLIGPDLMGIDNNRIERFLAGLDRNKLDAYCHHYHTGFYPDWMKQTAEFCADKPIYQTEFLINEGQEWGGWLEHAECINNALTIEGVELYCIFALAYKNASTHCFFSLDTNWGDWYETRPTYYMFKHFSKSIHRGWRRIDAAANGASVQISAYGSNDNDSMAVIMINMTASPQSIALALPCKTGEWYQTTDSLKYQFRGTFNDSATIELDGRSLTTLDLRNGPDCRTVSVTTETGTGAATAAVKAALFEGSGTFVTLPVSRGPFSATLFDLRGKRIASTTADKSSTAGAVRRLFPHAVARGAYICVVSCGTVTVQKNMFVTD
ncbi:MAG: hypothetical protein JW913_08160 [Chitinispirillaceae bacterium]|nr:hypothetical protein [Chitinispirillaceae bacterium]